MTALLMAVTLTDLAPFIVFAAIVAGAWFLMSALTRTRRAAEGRLVWPGRATWVGDIDGLDDRKQRFSGLKDALAQLGGAIEGKSELERNKLKLQLVNAGFRGDNAPMIYHGLRLLCLTLFLLPTSGFM